MESKLDSAQIGKLFVNKVAFEWIVPSRDWIESKRAYVEKPGHWNITANLVEKLTDCGYSGESMKISVEQGVGEKLAALLMPVVVAQASAKAQKLADDTKAMMAALGERTVACIADAIAATKPKDEPTVIEAEES